jgi:hypothetical protein
MEMRIFGRTGMQLSVLGFLGCSALLRRVPSSA